MRQACGADRPYKAYSITERDMLNAADAAIRVVLAEAERLCSLPSFGVDATAFGDPVKWSRPPNNYEIIARIRSLAATGADSGKGET